MEKLERPASQKQNYSKLPRPRTAVELTANAMDADAAACVLILSACLVCSFVLPAWPTPCCLFTTRTIDSGSYALGDALRSFLPLRWAFYYLAMLFSARLLCSIHRVCARFFRCKLKLPVPRSCTSKLFNRREPLQVSVKLWSCMKWLGWIFLIAKIKLLLQGVLSGRHKVSQVTSCHSREARRVCVMAQQNARRFSPCYEMPPTLPPPEIRQQIWKLVSTSQSAILLNVQFLVVDVQICEHSRAAINCLKRPHELANSSTTKS